MKIMTKTDASKSSILRKEYIEANVYTLGKKNP